MQRQNPRYYRRTPNPMPGVKKHPSDRIIKTEAARRNPADGQKTKPATDY